MISVGLGASCGALLRYLITYLWKRLRIDWPLATLVINLTGAFCLGLLIHEFPGNQFTILFWETGFLGGYTTFSTLNTELVAMYNDQKWFNLAIYAFSSYFGGILLAWIGMQI
ncbi:FluC/FEX family fluoride channel [Limosilactobacillus sp.]|jgi:CrcB protein|uniref:FluC/FEX family fluoride channel n=1 Tax=Limosilactobacillus sp. TaxID=2773925 RepID=UPI0025B8AD40|nr:CrcB family protein [Limosilactobacillus sp.]MCI2031276.1 CrcB family protein [Limosilactobacillus sp.]